ncbi:MAG: hypothetical protein ACREEL_14360 [Stellaceae bacterium]
MTEEIDIWHGANFLVKRHSADALVVAVQRADQWLAEGDADGQRIWTRISAALRELQRAEPAAGEWRN